MAQYAIIIEDAGPSNYCAYCPDLPGVIATGETLEECRAEMADAVAFHVEGMRLNGEEIPPPQSHTSTVVVTE